MGTYGLLRFNIGLFPDQARHNAPWINALAIIGIIYGALVALVQPNLKKLIAYSSVSHLGFVVLGIFTFTQIGTDGAVYQMLNHGVSTGALFMLAGMIYERKHKKPDSDEMEELTEEDRLLKPVTIDGVVTPYVIDHFRNGIQTSRINYESVELNKTIADSLFAKPANIKAIK